MAAKVTIHDETPSQKIIAETRAIEEVTDSLGRTIKVRKRLGLAEQGAFFLVAGQDALQNMVWITHMLPVWCVVEVDGVPVPTIRHMADFNAAAERLGIEGALAVAPIVSPQLEQLTVVINAMADAKNSAGTPL